MSQTVPRPCLPTGKEKQTEVPSDFFSRPYVEVFLGGAELKSHPKKYRKAKSTRCHWSRENTRNYSGTQLIDITCDFFEDFVVPEFL